ncbi:MAG TPA: hypothetical protein VHO24_11450, partial [Opitutaceae bacterium]|nr:hypothetical protein [Opitutaceae bacterium]
RGAHREHILENLPDCEELLSDFLQQDRSAWTEMENLLLYDQFNGPLRYNPARGARIMGEVFKAVKEGRLKAPKLAHKAQGVLSNIANAMLRTRGDEQDKIPLILQVIDERSRPNSEICAQSIVSMFASLDASRVLQHPDARTLLVKAKAYGAETDWAKFMDPGTSKTLGKDYPGEQIRKKVLELTTAAASADPSYRDLL